MQTAKKKKVMTVTVNAELCKGCGYCEEQCAKGVFDVAEACNSQGYHYRVAARPQDCVGCLTCFMICPDFAITVREEGEEDAA